MWTTWLKKYLCAARTSYWSYVLIYCLDDLSPCVYHFGVRLSQIYNFIYMYFIDMKLQHHFLYWHIYSNPCPKSRGGNLEMYINPLSKRYEYLICRRPCKEDRPRWLTTRLFTFSIEWTHSKEMTGVLSIIWCPNEVLSPSVLGSLLLSAMLYKNHLPLSWKNPKVGIHTNSCNTFWIIYISF